MNENKNISIDEEKFLISKRRKTFYIRLAIVYSTLLILLLFAVNIDTLESAIFKIFAPFTPIFFGAVIAYLCNPLFVFFQNRVFKKMRSVGARKALSIILTYILIFVILAGLLLLVAHSIIDGIQNFIEEIPQTLSGLRNFIVDFIDGLGFIKSEAEIGGAVTTPLPGVTEIPTTTDVPIVTTTPSVDDTVNILDLSFTKESIIEAIDDFIADSGKLLMTAGGEILNAVISSGTIAFNFVINLFLGFIFSIYMLTEKDLIIAKAKKIVYSCFKKDRADAICAMGTYADDKVGHFLKGKLIESLIVGLMAFVAFLIFGIPAPVLIAVIVAVMNMIPFFGPFLGAIPAALIVLIMEPSKAIPYVIIVLIIMQISGNYISPKIVGNRTGLTPLGAIVALTLMSGYFGLVGMFLGIPICAIVVEVLWTKSDSRLRKNQLATEIEAYYPSDALVEDPNHKKHKNITSIIVDATTSVFCKIFKVNKNKDQDKNADGTSNADN
ncbi:MAG: AI-2E family transporter [Ruminococcaceae bacterium]|nr:AI-2E family transporter [Oscillospiraceae bacterium]